VKATIHKSFPQRLLPILLSAAGLLFTLFPAGAIIDATLQMQLGNPSNATTDTNNYDHYLIQRPVEAMDYNARFGQPNWASWDLTTGDVGSSGRSSSFYTDTSLPTNFFPVPGDPINPFSGSGYDRGHMCPSGDRTTNTTYNDMVFLMSNIIPQASAQNEGIWANLEDQCRTLANAGNELLITCGPSSFTTNTLYNNHVTIPAWTWKIAVVVPLGAGTATNRITPSTQVIAVRIPNTSAVGSDPWQNYRTNVVAIESDTSFTFFSALPPNLATVLRNKIDGQTPPAPAITGFSPTSGAVNSSVTITGTNLVFATNVTFNGTSAPFTIDSTAQITATVPAGATSGLIGVQTLGGTAASASPFTVGGTTVTDLAMVATHTGSFTQGDIGDTYILVVTNTGTGASSSTITVVDTLPAGLTATSISGAGWTTNLGALTCTRSDALAPGAAYPPVAITVNVATNTAAAVTNTATVSGGGDASPANNTASDPTTINTALAPTVTTGAATAVGSGSATLNGTVNPNGQPATVLFQYGTNLSYGSVASVSGTITGSTAQAVSASLTGLLSGTTYHFRVTATNVLGSSSGLNQTFNTEVPGVADLAITATHAGNFTQGDASDTYTIIVTNAGTAASSGMVTVVDTLPTGLTATAISGAGWTTNLGTLTCTRSDALSVGTAYPPITVNVTVAANAAANVTNTATVSGGGDASPANNTASDPTSISAATAPTATTGVATGIGTTGATLNGTVDPNGQTTTAHFDYGLTAGYGLTASVSGDFTGTTTQAVTASLTGLTAETTYHFRVAATNALGATNGLDQTFTTAPTGTPDLAITVAHAGNFTQGDISDTYTIAITNVGAAASSGMVTVTNALPGGLTATAISGSGWTTNLATLTCTRSDALAAGASYPAIIVTVSVATNAPANVTNTASVSGGSDTSPANNTANDPTTINPASSGGGTTTLVGWDVSGLAGGSGNFGSSPLASTTNAANLTLVAGLTRGTGVGVTGTAAARGWGGNNWMDTSSAAAITANRFATFTVAAVSGYNVSFATIGKFDYRHSGTGPTNGLLQYQVGSGAFTDVTALSYPTNTSGGASLSPIDLSGISALQNIGPGTNVTFRIVNWGGTNSAGSWYIFDVANSTALDFAVQGTLSPVLTPAADLTISTRHTGSFTQGDIGDSYTITVTNIGAAATVGAVSVTDTLPAGLTATALSGDGWSANLSNLTCTRSDTLAAGASYPPITVTLSVSAGADASVTNAATVSGGGDATPANNTASDPTAVNAAAAPTATTGAATALGATTATLNGTVSPNGQPATVQFQYGLTPSYGSTTAITGGFSGTTTQAVSANLTGLVSGTSYHFRIAATNVLGANAGLDRVFTTLAPIEAWRLQWFGTTTNSGASADSTIGTSDGMPNLLKYALGLNPLVATNDPVAGDISTGFLRLTVPKNPDATDVTFHVEVTSDVMTASWTNGTTIDINTATLLQAHDNAPVASSDGAFIRLRVSRP
jgi:uncharacterized repeat protein (TIGR01451 family)